VKYYSLAIDEGMPDAWYLRIEETFPDGTPVDKWAYLGTERVEDLRPVPFAIHEPGPAIDFNPTPFSATVVSKRLADYWESMARHDVQRIPAIVGDDCKNWEVFVVLRTIDCIDRDRSVIDYYPPNHSEKPNEQRGVWNLVLDTSRIGDHHLFHPKGWEVTTIVSETVMKGMLAMGITGAAFMPVTD
jgi:hypothetical protein